MSADRYQFGPKSQKSDEVGGLVPVRLLTASCQASAVSLPPESDLAEEAAKRRNVLGLQ